jgi:hypothetical protein
MAVLAIFDLGVLSLAQTLIEKGNFQTLLAPAQHITKEFFDGH